VKKLLFLVLGSFAGVFPLVACALSHSTLDGPQREAALAKLNGDSRALEALGGPITASEGARGSTWSVGSRAKVDARFPVVGPRGAGTLDVVGYQVEGLWEYAVFDLEVNGQHLELRRSQRASNSPANPRTGVFIAKVSTVKLNEARSSSTSQSMRPGSPGLTCTRPPRSQPKSTTSTRPSFTVKVPTTCTFRVEVLASMRATWLRSSETASSRQCTAVDIASRVQRCTSPVDPSQLTSPSPASSVTRLIRGS